MSTNLRMHSKLLPDVENKSYPKPRGTLVSRSLEKTIQRLNRRSARQAFTEAEAVTAIAHQIRVVRQQRGMTQKDLARQLNTTQAAISRLEDPSYGRFSIKSLIDIAKVFDVSLQVRFVSTVKLLIDTRRVTKEQLEVPDFETEAADVAYVANLSTTFVAQRVIHDQLKEQNILKFEIGTSSTANMFIASSTKEVKHEHAISVFTL